MHLSPLRVGAVILIVILTIAAFAARRRFDYYLSGMWVGEPAFLKRAALGDYQLFIDKPSASDRTRQGYLIIAGEDGKLISNQAIEIRMSAPLPWVALWGSRPFAARDAYTVSRADFEYDDADAGVDAPMPSRLKIALSAVDGTLTLYDDSKVYAHLMKDHIASTAGSY